MTEFREERFYAYCQYCEKCLYNLYASWMNSQARGRDLKDFSDSSWKDDIENLDGDFSWNVHRELGGCPGINSCWSYKKVCNNGAESDFEDYFECTEVERNNGMTVYVGPHCASDGFTVNLGVYGDEYCNEYIGNGVDIQNVLGEKLEENYLLEYVSGTVDALNQMNEYFPEFGFCIPCKAQVSVAVSSLLRMLRVGQTQHEPLISFLSQDQPWGLQTGDDDDYVSGEDEVIELCENLYQASARCDKHYRSWSNKAKQSKMLAAQMDFQCDFIDSVVTGNYDEMGFVVLDQENITNPSFLAGLMEKTFSLRTTNGMTPASVVTPLQVFGLCASIFACCILGLWAMALRSGKKMPMKGWKIRRAQPAIARQDSGIMLGRSDEASFVSPN